MNEAKRESQTGKAAAQKSPEKKEKKLLLGPSSKRSPQYENDGAPLFLVK